MGESKSSLKEDSKKVVRCFSDIDDEQVSHLDDRMHFARSNDPSLIHQGNGSRHQILPFSRRKSRKTQ